MGDYDKGLRNRSQPFDKLRMKGRPFDKLRIKGVGVSGRMGDDEKSQKNSQSRWKGNS